MKFRFEFDIFGKTMRAEVDAPNESEAREVLYRKIREQVKITRVEPKAPKTEGGFVEGIEEMFDALGIKTKKWR